MEDFGVNYVHLVYFTAVWNILRPFGIFYGYLVDFSPFWFVVPRKLWQPCSLHTCVCVYLPSAGPSLRLPAAARSLSSSSSRPRHAFSSATARTFELSKIRSLTMTDGIDIFGAASETETTSSSSCFRLACL
jgi:hypothetical protein